MSSEDHHHDNSPTVALLQASGEEEAASAGDKRGPSDEELVDLSKGEQPDQTTSDNDNDNDDNVDASSSPTPRKEPTDEDPKPAAELSVENETDPQTNSTTLAAEEVVAAPAVNSEGAAAVNSSTNDVENPKEGQGQAEPEGEGENADDVTPIAPKSSRFRRFKKISAEKARMATSIEDIGSLRLWKGIAAEFMGTLLLTLIGCGSCINLEGAKMITNPTVQIALCFGLSVATIVWAIGHVSGGHINPAVTLAMLATRKISLVKAAFFVIAQLIGAIVGAGLLYGLSPVEYQGFLGCTLVNEKVQVGQALGVEIFITFVLVFVIFASVDNKRKDLNGSVPLTIGLSVTMCHLFAIPFTGSSMNTARSFGPAVVMDKWDDHWVYWLGPILGGVMAGLLYDNLFAVNASLDKAKACLLSSDYDDDRYQAHKMKIRIIEEDPEDPKEEAYSLNEKSGGNRHDSGDQSNV